MDMATLQENDLVKDVYGDWHRVLTVERNIIYTYDQRRVHISKVIKVRRMTIPEKDN